MEAQETQGALPRAWDRLFGSGAWSRLFTKRVERLRERAAHAHWLSYLLIISTSITVILVFGRTEVTYLFAANLAVRLVALLALFVLLITVLAADIALLATITRIPILKRNRQYGALWEHRAYQYFVLLVEGATLGVVLYTLDSDPQALAQGRPLIPSTGKLFLALVIMRVVMWGWSFVQLIIVKQRLPVLLSTLTNTMKEIVGGQVEQQLETMDVSHINTSDLYGVYKEAVRPPRPIDGFLNWLTGGWIVRRALAQEAEEERQANNVQNALGRINAHSSTTNGASPARPQHVTQPRHLSAREQRRLQLERDMYGVRGHPTSPRGMDDPDDDDGPDWGSAEIDWDAEDWAAPRAKARPNMSQHAAARHNGSSAAHIAPRFSEMVVDLPEGKTERRDDSPEAKKVMRYLDKHPGAKINDVVQKTGVSRPTVRRHYTAWIERNKRVDADPAPFTEEMPAITSEQLAERV